MHRIKIRYRPSQRMTNRVEENTLSKLLKARNNGRARLVLEALGRGSDRPLQNFPITGPNRGPSALIAKYTRFCLVLIGYAQELYLLKVLNF